MSGSTSKGVPASPDQPRRTAAAVMPVLPPAVYAQVYGTSGSAGAGDSYGLPQALADRFGWEQQVALIAQVYHSLPPSEQRVACIFTSNYGEAAALVQFGGRYHLPPPISGHNAFYIWGPHGCTGQVIITINIAPLVAPAVEGIDLFKIAGRSISGWIPSFKTGTASHVRQPFCSQLEERLLL